MPPEELEEDELELLEELELLLDDEELELLDELELEATPQLAVVFSQTPAYCPGVLLLHQCSCPAAQL